MATIPFATERNQCFLCCTSVLHGCVNAFLALQLCEVMNLWNNSPVFTTTDRCKALRNEDPLKLQYHPISTQIIKTPTVYKIVRDCMKTLATPIFRGWLGSLSHLGYWSRFCNRNCSLLAEVDWISKIKRTCIFLDFKNQTKAEFSTRLQRTSFLDFKNQAEAERTSNGSWILHWITKNFIFSRFRLKQNKRIASICMKNYPTFGQMWNFSDHLQQSGVVMTTFQAPQNSNVHFRQSIYAIVTTL